MSPVKAVEVSAVPAAIVEGASLPPIVASAGDIKGPPSGLALPLPPMLLPEEITSSAKDATARDGSCTAGRANSILNVRSATAAPAPSRCWGGGVVSSGAAGPKDTPSTSLMRTTTLLACWPVGVEGLLNPLPLADPPLPGPDNDVPRVIPPAPPCVQTITSKSSLSWTAIGRYRVPLVRATSIMKPGSADRAIGPALGTERGAGCFAVLEPASRATTPLDPPAPLAGVSSLAAYARGKRPNALERATSTLIQSCEPEATPRICRKSPALTDTCPSPVGSKS
jgi:hypothetical protein